MRQARGARGRPRRRGRPPPSLRMRPPQSGAPRWSTAGRRCPGVARRLANFGRIQRRSLVARGSLRRRTNPTRRRHPHEREHHPLGPPHARARGLAHRSTRRRPREVAEALSKRGVESASLTSAEASNISTGNWTFTQTVLDALAGATKLGDYVKVRGRPKLVGRAERPPSRGEHARAPHARRRDRERGGRPGEQHRAAPLPALPGRASPVRRVGRQAL